LDAKFELSIIAIIFAAIFDALDGRVARLLKGTSLVGKELDSLADLISFGVAPAFIMYFWSLNNLGKFGWLLTMIYVVCVALRLARFNVSSNSEPSWKDNYFEGVPSPAGGILVLMPLILSLSEINLIKINYDIVVPAFFILIAFLLISKVPTFAFKKITIPRRMTIFALFGIVLFFGLLLIYTFKVLVICGLIYIGLIPMGYFSYKKINKQKTLSDENNENDDLEDIL
jgi:CDP-diacylglycerol--serine O-phosphatidyltransferase